MTGRLGAGNVRQGAGVVPAPVKARPVINIEIVDPGRRDLDERLPRSKLGGRGIFVAKHLGAAELVNADRPHAI